MGRFEQADNGTLFIDEVGDFELPLQAALARVLLETLTVTPVGGHEDRSRNVRIIAATSRDIRKMVEEGTFREDLFYRLNVITVMLPSLRQRPDDIRDPRRALPGGRSVEQEHACEEGVARGDAAVPEHRQPGNARKRRRAGEHDGARRRRDPHRERPARSRIAAASTEIATPKEIPAGVTMEELEKLAITKAASTSVPATARTRRTDSISVRTLQRKLRQYELERGPSDPGDVLTGRLTLLSCVRQGVSVLYFSMT